MALRLRIYQDEQMVDRDIDLITFDIFGTVLNWFEGMRESVARKGAQLDKETFDRVINYQGDIEQKNLQLTPKSQQKVSQKFWA